MPEHRCSITKDGISFLPMIIFTRKIGFNPQIRRVIRREGTARGETDPPFTFISYCIRPRNVHFLRRLLNAHLSNNDMKSITIII